MIRRIGMIMILFTASIYLGAQCTNPPNGVDCTCSTAQLLCTPDLLDGFTFSMSTTPNLGGYNSSSSDLCPGLPDDGVPNNVNWFSFIAWCTDLDMDIQISNCIAGSFGSFGVQIALFSNCPIGGALFCETDGGVVCGTAGNYPTLQTLSVSGLTIGDPYYFMLDGCAGSACDITLDVIGTCGTGMIDPWTTGISGPLTTCVGNTDNYVTEDLDGAVQFYYTLDGAPLIDGDELTSINSTWNTAGTYELCVDVANEPCIPITDMPDPYCITILVCESADAGSISAASPYCPGDIANISVSGEQQGTDHDQYIIVTNSMGVIVNVISGNLATLTSNFCEDFIIYSYNVKTGSPIPMIGMSFPSDFPCTDNCCDIEALPVVFEDIIPPVFTSPPANIVLACFDELVLLEDLSWTDNCIGAGDVTGTESGSADACDGGTITRTWTIADECGNQTTHNQVITISPTPPSTFDVTPTDENITCELIPTTVPDLTYSNTGVGQCAVGGTIVGNSSGVADLCGGTITRTWNDIDACGNSLMHTQIITVDPVPEASFISPPSDMTVNCANVPVSFPDLDYDNGEVGVCSIVGTAASVVVTNYDICGGTIDVSWGFVDACARPGNVSQTITVDPAPPAVFTSVLPTSIVVDCDAIPAPSGALDYSNGSSGACAIEGSITPEITDNSDPCGGDIIYEWNFVDQCGQTLSHMQTITINPAPIPSILNPPSDITLDCSQLPLATTNIDYSNGLIGSCGLNGTITSTLTPFDPCTGVVTEQWNGTDACGNVLNLSRTITITPIESPVFDSPPSDITVSCDAVPSSFANLNYSNNTTGPCRVEGSATPTTQANYDACGGELVVTWQANDGCGGTFQVQQVVTVTPGPSPSFASPAADVTVSCLGVPAPANLSYSNGLSGPCAISGAILPTTIGSFDVCGGSFSYVWTFIDPCGVEITATRNITVSAAPQASFTTMPPDITVNCEDVNAISSLLSYSNNLNGNCAIAGAVIANTTGSYDICGGQINQAWSFLDECDRLISYDRNITVDPADAPVFINPPPDITLECGANFVPPASLSYSNGLSSPCQISGTAGVTTIQNGNVYTNTWEYINPCTNIPESYSQNVTQSPIPNITIDPLTISICEGQVFDLSVVNVVDQNNTNITLSYFLGTPIVPGTELSSTIISPTVSSLYTILATNEYDCSDEAIFTLMVDELPTAGEDGTIDICDNIIVDLFSLLGGNYDFGGTWLDLDAAEVNLDDPSSVLFTGLLPGEYSFAYVVQSGNTCPNDTAIVEVNYSQLPTIIVDSVYCENGNTSFVVVVQNNGFEVLPTAGTLENQGNGIIVITDIPIDNQVVINFFDGQTFCADFVVISPPDCNCPQVSPAMPLNQTICQEDLPATLTAIAAAGTTINWYGALDATVPLAVNTTTYTSPELNSGTYTYYLEAESIDFPGCYASQRVPLQLTIVSSPSVTNAEVNFCIEIGESLSTQFQQYNSTINSNANNSFMYFESLDDAEELENELFEVNFSVSTTFYVVVTNVSNCTSVASLDLILNVNPDLTTSVQGETCDSEADGEISLEISPSGSYEILINGNSYSDPVVSNLNPGLYYISIADDMTGCAAQDTVTIDEGQLINEDFFMIQCQNNGTDTEPLDDYYEVSFQFSESTGNSTSYELIVGSETQGIFPYSIGQLVTIPADGLIVTVELIDQATGCSVISSIGPLNPCSTNCQLSIIDLSQTCNDNQSSSDPTDDFIVFFLEVSAINGSTSNAYDVLINGMVEYSFMYDQQVSFNMPADGTTPNIILIDSEDPQCLLALDALPLDPCSNSCNLAILDVITVCSDSGTEDDPSDDIITISVEVEVLNGGSNQVSIRIDNQAGVVQNINTIEITQPADGNFHWLYINALDSLSCADSLQIGPFNPCSSDCNLKLEYYSIECSDSGTPFDPTDDFYDIAWLVQAIEGSADSMYNVLLDGNSLGTELYSDTVFFTIPADGLTHTITMVDQTSSFCQEIIQTILLQSCSDSCSISVSPAVVFCENNGTNDTSDDDVFFAEFVVDGLNLSECWSILNETGTYPYDQIVTLGPFSIMEGDVIIIIEDCDNNTCPISFDIEAPPTCSACAQAIEAGMDAIIDCDYPTATLVGNSSEVGSYSWTGPGGNISIDSTAVATMEGWYYFQAEYTDGCVLLDSLFVTANGVVPSGSAGEDKMLTCEVNEIELIGVNTSAADDVIYFWINEAGDTISQDINVLVSTSGLYTFVIYDTQTGCFSAGDDVFVGLDIEEPEVMILANPTTILNCVVESVELTYIAEDNVIYQWSTDAVSEPSIQTVYIIDSSGVVYLNALDTITGCLAVDTIVIESVEEFPIINLIEFDSLTCDQTSVVIDATNTIPLQSSIFVWRNSMGVIISQDPVIEIDYEGVFTLEVLDTITGCVNVDTVELVNVQNYPSVSVDSPITLFCAQTDTVVSVFVDSEGFEISWTSVGGNITSDNALESVSVSGGGMYIVEVTDNITGCVTVDTVTILELDSTPNIENLQISSETCFQEEDGQIQWSAVSGGTAPYEVIVDGELVEEVGLDGLPSGIYNIIVTDTYGCVLDTLIEILPAEILSVTDIPNLEIIEGDSDSIYVITSIPESDIASVVWEPSSYLSCSTCLVTQVTPLEDISYLITITDINGCVVSTIVDIMVRVSLEVYIPNTFSPDGDGINDVFTLFSPDITLIEKLDVYNRWGELMYRNVNFEANNLSLGWDGQFKGRSIDPGVYVYYAVVQLTDGSIRELAGDVTIIR